MGPMRGQKRKGDRMELKIYGSSDDNIYVLGLPEGAYEHPDGTPADGYHDTCSFNMPPQTFRVEGEGCALRVSCIYWGYWAFAVGSMTGEDHDQMLKGSIARTWGEDCPYSETVRISGLPEDAKVIWEERYNISLQFSQAQTDRDDALYRVKQLEAEREEYKRKVKPLVRFANFAFGFLWHDVDREGDSLECDRCPIGGCAGRFTHEECNEERLRFFGIED
jgi:hypothetical protein